MAGHDRPAAGYHHRRADAAQPAVGARPPHRPRRRHHRVGPTLGALAAHTGITLALDAGVPLREVEDYARRPRPAMRAELANNVARGPVRLGLVSHPVGVRWHRGRVRVTQAEIARVPLGNLRVPRAEFGAVWAAAEQCNTEQGERGLTDWYAAGVVVTCRWLAGATVRSSTGRWHVAYAPVTRRSMRAYEELIEAEFLAAERLPARSPDLVERRPGWCEAIRATLRWAWRHDGPPPRTLAGTQAAPAGVIGTA